MNNTMKRRMIAFVAAIAAVVSLSGCDDNYDETPPLAKDYLTKYIMPDGVFLGNLHCSRRRCYSALVRMTTMNRRLRFLLRSRCSRFRQVL